MSRGGAWFSGFMQGSGIRVYADEVYAFRLSGVCR